MRLDPSRRALLMLLGCLLMALVFPAALTETRVGVGRLLPATAPVTGETQTSAWADQASAVMYENIRIRQEMAAQPSGDSPIMAAVEAETGVRKAPLRAVPARLLHRDVSPTRRSFLIDVGRERGIEPGFAVAHGNSLIGVVQVVSDGASRVIRIDDTSPHAVLPAMVLRFDRGEDGRVGASVREGGRGVSHGTRGGNIVVSKLAEGAAVPGDLVVTGDGRFGIPAGLLLGEVESFDDEDRDGEWEAVVRPQRDLDTIVAVYVCVRPKLADEVKPRGGNR